MLKLGVNTGLWTYAGLSIEEACSDICNLGFKYIDLFTRLNCDPTHMNIDDMKQLYRIIKNYKLIVSSLCSVIPVNFIENEQNNKICLNYMIKNFELSEILGARLVLMKNGSKVLGKSFNECWCESIKFVKDLCKEAKKKGLILILEMEPSLHSLTNSADTSSRYLQELNEDNCLMNVDTGHFFIAKNSPEEIKEYLKSKVMHLHVSDNNGISDTNDVLGVGMVPLREYLNACIESGINETCKKYNIIPVAGMEIGSSRRSVFKPKTEAKMSLEYLKENFDLLKLY